MVDLPAALEALPEVYARALRLQLDGATDEAIAAELGLDRQAVPSVLRLARDKLVTLLSA